MVVCLTRKYIEAVNSGDERDPCCLEFMCAASQKKAGNMIPLCVDDSIQDPLSWGGSVGRVLAGRLCVMACGDLGNHFYLRDRASELYQRVSRIISMSDDKHLCVPSHRPSSRSLSGDRKPLAALDVEEVGRLLDYHNMSNYIEELREKQVDGECLSLCESPQEVQDLGVQLLPKARLLLGKIQAYTREGVRREVLEGGGRMRGRSGDWSESEGCGRHADARQSAAARLLSSTGAATSQTSYSSSRLQCLRVEGCVGERARDINGVYEPTDEKFDGFCRYLKKGGQNNWMEYNAARGHWHIKKAESKGSVNAWAYCMSSIVAPPDRIGGCWHVYNGSDFPEQPSLRVTTVYESVLVQGAVGPCAQPVNGMYDPTAEECGGWIRYRKRWGQHDCWMEYNEARGQWHIKPSASKGTTNAWAFFSQRPVCAPDKHNGAGWFLYDGNKFVKQEQVITIPEPVSVCIKGATGSCMQQVNGIFDPVADVYGGFLRYKKRGGQDCWMEYHEQRKQWWVGVLSSRYVPLPFPHG